MPKELDIQIGMLRRRTNIDVSIGSGGIPANVARMEIRTTDEWNEARQYIPRKGTIIVYSDRRVVDGVDQPGVKIADGLAYVVDLPFVGEAICNDIMALLNEHINDPNVHVTPEDREFWNNKLNYTVQNGNLILTRD